MWSKSKCLVSVSCAILRWTADPREPGAIVDRRRAFHVDRPPRNPWWAWGLAVLLHLPIAALLVTTVWHHTTAGWRQQEAVRTESTETPHTVRFSLPAPVQPELPTRLPQPAEPPMPPPAAGAGQAPTSMVQDLAGPRLRGALEGVAPTMRAPASVPGGPVRSNPVLVTGPQYGSGILWGHLPPPTPEALARQALGVSSGPRIDSATTVRLQRYIDSLSVEQQRLRPQPPRWTTSLGGQTVGLDAQWIHLGPIRIPTAILALLPITMAGNPTQQEYTRKLDVMREDLYIAAGRAQNYADFRAAVAKLRAEREAEQAFRDAQRRRPTGGNPQE